MAQSIFDALTGKTCECFQQVGLTNKDSRGQYDNLQEEKNKFATNVVSYPFVGVSLDSPSVQSLIESQNLITEVEQSGMHSTLSSLSIF